MGSQFQFLSLAAQLFTANGAVDHFIVAACYGTGGLDTVFLNSLTGSVGSQFQFLSLAAQLFTANGAVDHFIVAACYGTGGLDTVFLNSLTGSVGSQFQFLSLAAQFFTANGAVYYTFIATCYSTSGLGSILLNSGTVSMVTSCGEYNSLAADFGVTDGAVDNGVVAAGGGAGSCLLVLNHRVALGVTQGGDGFSVGITTGASVGTNACSGAGSCGGHLGGIAMGMTGAAFTSAGVPHSMCSAIGICSVAGISSIDIATVAIL